MLKRQRRDVIVNFKMKGEIERQRCDLIKRKTIK